MLNISLLLAFISVVLFIYGLYLIIFGKRILVRKRLEIYAQSEDYFEGNDIQPVTIREQLFNLIVVIGRALSGRTYMENKRKKLSQAYIFMRVEEFIGISLISGLAIGLLLFYLTKVWITGIIGLILGFSIPDIFVDVQRKKRIKRLNSQLPEALTIMSNGLRAGFSFTQAMGIACSELEPPISDEFSRVLRDNSIGKTLEESLYALVERTDDEDMDMFVTALIIQRKVGGNLAEILDTIANTIRDRVKIRGDVRTLTAQGRISALVISILPFAVAGLIFTINPSYMLELLSNSFGIVMLITALVMQVVGIFIIRRMVKIKI